jgi:hypothetical protein
MWAMKKSLSLPLEIPEKDSQVQEEFPAWLSLGSLKGPIVILIDGIQLLNPPGLGWLPSELPDSVRVILTDSSSALASLRGWQARQVRGFVVVFVNRALRKIPTTVAAFDVG